MSAYVYIVSCSDGSLYTGYTKNIDRRTRTHNAGRGAKYTRSRLPVRLVYSEECENVKDALRREYAVKQLTRREKLLLIQAGKATETDETGTKTDADNR